jgi:HAD superfamily hydrolase (TIGR01509 family)
MRSISDTLRFIPLVLLALCPLNHAFVVMPHHGRSETVATALHEGRKIPFADYKAVIFDIDGTLADSFKLGFDATRVVLKNNQIDDITEDMYHECTIYATPERMARHAGVFPGDDDYDEVSSRLAKEFDDLYIGLVSMETAQFYPGVREMIFDIPEHILVGALTNAAHQYAHAVLRVNSAEDGAIYNRFSSIRGADDVPKPKPHPDGLLVVCKDMNGVDPASCVYIGDSPSDGAAAKNAGMTAIGVLWGSHAEAKVRAAPFDYVCDTIDSLRALLPQTTFSAE